MKKVGKDFWRWFLFIPISIICSSIVKFILSKIGGGTLEIFFPKFGYAISGFLIWMFAAITLIYIANKIVPTNNKRIIKVYALGCTFFIIVWSFYLKQLVKIGVVSGPLSNSSAETFWILLVINLGYIIGIWGTYIRLFYIQEERSDPTDE